MKMARIEKHFINAADHSRRVAALTERRLRMVPCRTGQKYLDVGCGNGAAALHVANIFGLDVTGIDADPEQIRLAREAAGGRGQIRFVVADATHLPFDAGEFDIVATNKTTHHIPEWENAVAEMARVLRPGGYFIYGDIVMPEWVAGVGRAIAGGRLGFVSSQRLERLVRCQGLDIDHSSARWGSYELVCQRGIGP